MPNPHPFRLASRPTTRTSSRSAKRTQLPSGETQPSVFHPHSFLEEAHVPADFHPCRFRRHILNMRSPDIFHQLVDRGVEFFQVTCPRVLLPSIASSATKNLEAAVHRRRFLTIVLPLHRLRQFAPLFTLACGPVFGAKISHPCAGLRHHPLASDCSIMVECLLYHNLS